MKNKMSFESIEMINKTKDDEFKDINLEVEDNENNGKILMKVLKPQLEKTLGVFGGVGLVVGSIIGSGIFLSPSSVLEGTGSVGMSLVVWTLCGLIALFGALCYVELGTEIPLSGAEYSYLYDAFKFSPFGKVAAFLYSWTSTLIIRPSAIAIISMIFAEYVTKPFYVNEDSPWLIKLVAFGCIGKE